MLKMLGEEVWGGMRLKRFEVLNNLCDKVLEVLLLNRDVYSLAKQVLVEYRLFSNDALLLFVNIL